MPRLSPASRPRPRSARARRRPPRQRRTSPGQTSRTQAAAPSPVPPLVAAIMRTFTPADSDHTVRAAYAAMPALLAATLEHDLEDYDNHSEIGDLIDRLSGVAAAQARVKPPHARGLPLEQCTVDRAVAVLSAVDEDLVTTLSIRIGDAAFWTGVALTTYLLTAGGPAPRAA